MRILALVILLASNWSVAEAQDNERNPIKINIVGVWRNLDPKLEKIGLTIEWEFTDSEVIVWDRTNHEEVSRSKYSIDKTKSPNWITVEIDDSADEDSGDKRLGIFRILGEELHLKQEVTNGAERPKGLKEGFLRFMRVKTTKPVEQVVPPKSDRAGG